MNRRSVIAGGAAALAGSFQSACGERGRTPIRILVGSGAGSAQDGLARLFAQAIGARLGQPVLVENDGRAGGKLVARRLAAAAPDAPLIAFLPTGLLYAKLLDEVGTDWDFARFGWLGGFGMDRRVLVVTGESGVRRFEDLMTRTRPLIVAAASTASPGFYEPAIIRHLTGARLTPIAGFVGGARNMALVSGEAEGVEGSLDGLGSVLQLEGARVLLRLNDIPLPGEAAPFLGEFAKGPDAAPLQALINAHARLGRIAALPPGAPEAVLALWRRRFEAVIADAGFRSEAARRGYQIEETDGATIAATIGGLLRDSAGGARPALRRALAA